MTRICTLASFAMLATLFASFIVGVVEIGPGVCATDFLVDGRITTVNLPCEAVVLEG